LRLGTTKKIPLLMPPSTPTFKRFARTAAYRKDYDNLSSEDQKAADEAFKIFKQNPFAPQLGTHKITRLSALYGEPVWSVRILGNLRSLFVIRDEVVVSVAIGTHDLYK
jgi:hypothetical protein